MGVRRHCGDVVTLAMDDSDQTLYKPSLRCVVRTAIKVMDVESGIVLIPC